MTMLKFESLVTLTNPDWWGRSSSGRTPLCGWLITRRQGKRGFESRPTVANFEESDTKTTH